MLHADKNPVGVWPERTLVLSHARFDAVAAPRFKYLRRIIDAASGNLGQHAISIYARRASYFVREEGRGGKK